jgi:hypothetical protein
MAATELKAQGEESRAAVTPALWRRPWAWPAGFVFGGLILFGIYLRQADNFPIQSDGASNALQAWDMLHGNLLLHGWTLTDLSFYTLDLPLYGLVAAVHGLNAGSAHIAAALTYTLVMVCAAILAKGRADGREALIRVLMVAGIMLTPPMLSGAATFLSDPDHTLTQVPLLLVWILLDRFADRPRWPVPVAIGVLLAWSLVADPLVTYEGILPIVLVCGLRLYRRRDTVLRQPRQFWYEGALIAASVVAAGAGTLALRLIGRVGGFTVTPPDTTLAQVHTLYTHVWVTVQSVLKLYGADFSGTQGIHAAPAVICLAGVALATWAACRALRRFTDMDLVTQVLVIALAVLLISYTVSGDPNVVGGPHEIVGVLPIGAVLAARLLTAQLITGRHLAAFGALLACYGLVLAHDFVQPPAPDADTQLAAFLTAHHLDYGVATWWEASGVTVDSGGKVQVRPVNRNEVNGHLMAIQRDSVPSWYDASRHDATFLIVPHFRMSCVQGSHYQWTTTLNADFGPPAATYKVAGFTIDVWNENLLSRITKPVGTAC